MHLSQTSPYDDEAISSDEDENTMLATGSGNISPEYGVILSDEYDSIMNEKIEIEFIPKAPSPIEGNRIVELGYVLDKALKLQFEHSQICTLGMLHIKEEKRRSMGLINKVILNCNQCNRVYELLTEDPKYEVSKINTGFVWGTLATGGTYSHSEELLSCMDIPPMPEKMFYDTEVQLGEEWKDSLWQSMEAAGIEEKKHALANQQLSDDGTPWIVVHVDGSWSKRSYGTNYNSNSGMVGIIGKFTGQLLFVAVRNKYCSVCARAENMGKVVTAHKCFKNWAGSASAMESDMVVEGFNLSQAMHGVKYSKFIADGDSSVFAKIREKVSYGSEISKIECTNHALKNYGKHLLKLKSDTHISLAGRKLLTQEKIKKLTKRAKCSIYEHSKKEDRNVELLREDLRTGLHHVFGNHNSCREGICNDLGDASKNQISELKNSLIYHHIEGALNLLLRKAHLLIENETNNTAERLMNIVSRFNMGKRLNLIQRGSYERRVFLSGLRYNKSLKWHYSPWKNFTNHSPGQHFKTFLTKHQNRNKPSSIQRNLFPRIAKNLPKTRNEDYGPQAKEVESDGDFEDFVKMEAELLIKHLQVSIDKRNEIQTKSIGQFGNNFYEVERRSRLTASIFGRVIKRRPHTPCHNIVKSCLENKHFYSEHTEFGLTHESVAVKLFEKEANLAVEPSGLWVDLEYGFLGASPDGLINGDAIIEIKCLSSASKLQLTSVEEAIAKLKSKCCLERNNDGIRLKRNHNYYYQIQGQLNITQKSKCYFVVYISDDIKIFIEEIVRDVEFWKQKMVPYLVKFYKECVAPELIRKNLGRNMKCVDPPYIKEAIEAFNQKKQRTEK